MPASSKIQVVDFSSLDLTYCSIEILDLPSISDNGIAGHWNVVPDTVASEVKVDSVTFTPSDITIDPITLAIEITLVDTIPMGPFIRCAESPPFFILNAMFLESVDTILVKPGQNEECDTFYNFKVIFLDSIKLFIRDTLCQGEIREYYNRTFDFDNPSSEFTETSQNGACDTTVFVNLEFLDFTTQLEQDTFCVGDSVIYDEVLYTRSFSSNQYTEMGQNGACDTVVTVDYFFRDLVEVVLIDSICSMESGVILGSNISPTTIDTVLQVSGQNGACDSIFQVSIFRLPTYVKDVNEPEICGEDTLYIGEQAFHTGNLNGQVTLQSQYGCDSVVIVDLRPGLEQEFILLDPCGEGIEWRGQEYLSDTTILVIASAPACDTLFQLQYLIGTPIDSIIQMTLCSGEEFQFLNETYNEENRQGMVLDSPQGECPTLYQIVLDYIEEIQVDIDTVICLGDTLVVGSQRFFSNVAAVPVTLLASNGCDSVIMVSVEAEWIVEEVFFASCQLPQVFRGDLISRDTIIERGGIRPACDTVFILLTRPDTVQVPTRLQVCEGDTVKFHNELFYSGRTSSIITESEPNGCVTIYSVDAQILDTVMTVISETLCPGESINVDGRIFNENEPSGEVVFAISGINSCDSIVSVDLSYVIQEIISQEITLCRGDTESIFGIEVNETSDLSAPFIFGPNGCDTVLSLSTRIVSDTSVIIRVQICPGGNVTIGGLLFDESRLEEEIILSTSDGCDSLVTIQVEVLDNYNTTVQEELCSGDFKEINGTVYDQGNPIGEENLIARNGCDSIVSISLSFIESFYISIDSFFCDITETLIVGNTTFSTNYHEGVEMLLSISGCDSIVSVDLEYFIYEHVEIIEESCPDQSTASYRLLEATTLIEMAFLNGQLGEIDEADILFNGLVGGNYTLELEFKNGCFRESIINIGELPRTDLETVITQNDSASNVSIVNTGLIDSIAWETSPNLSCQNCPDVIIRNSSQTNYSVEIWDINGCSSTHMVQLEEPAIVDTTTETNHYLPNVISPISVNANQLFYLQTMDESVVSYSYEIYDRWGNMVSSTRNLNPNMENQGWDGLLSNGQYRSDVYVYKIEILKSDGRIEILVGDILVLL